LGNNPELSYDNAKYKKIQKDKEKVVDTYLFPFTGPVPLACGLAINVSLVPYKTIIKHHSLISRICIPSFFIFTLIPLQTSPYKYI
jgi:hypothetical protein